MCIGFITSLVTAIWTLCEIVCSSDTQHTTVVYECVFTLKGSLQLITSNDITFWIVRHDLDPSLRPNLHPYPSLLHIHAQGRGVPIVILLRGRGKGGGLLAGSHWTNSLEEPALSWGAPPPSGGGWWRRRRRRSCRTCPTPFTGHLHHWAAPSVRGWDTCGVWQRYRRTFLPQTLSVSHNQHCSHWHTDCIFLYLSSLFLYCTIIFALCCCNTDNFPSVGLIKDSHILSYLDYPL